MIVTKGVKISFVLTIVLQCICIIIVPSSPFKMEGDFNVVTAEFAKRNEENRGTMDLIKQTVILKEMKNPTETVYSNKAIETLESPDGFDVFLMPPTTLEEIRKLEFSLHEG